MKDITKTENIDFLFHRDGYKENLKSYFAYQYFYFVLKELK